MKKSVCLVLIGIIAGSLLTGCGNKNQQSESQQSKTTFEDEAEEKEPEEKEPEKSVSDENKDEVDYGQTFDYEINEDGKTINLITYEQKGEIENIEIPEEIDGYTVTGLSYPNGKGLFLNDAAIKSVMIPSTVVGIGDGCFFQCENLEKIEMKEGLQEIGGDVFLGCTNLQELIFPETVKTIGDFATEECGNLKKIVLPEGLENLGQYNFRGCNDELKVYLTAGSPAEEMVKNIYANEEDASGSYIAQ